MAIAIVMLSGCAAAHDPQTGSAQLPHIVDWGSRAREFTSLDQVADISSALVTVVPTGKHWKKAVPVEPGGDPSPAPLDAIEMRVTKVLSGSVPGETIDLVSPGWDQNSDGPALQTGGPYLMYITPAMYGANDPARGYVVTGGPAGVYGSDGVNGEFAQIDTESPDLPPVLQSSSKSLPKPTRSEAELLTMGPG